MKEVLSMANININDLTKEINKQLATYTEEVGEAVSEATDEVTKEGVKLLKIKSPDKTGDYRKGWARKKSKNGFIIHNRTDYQLTHLLEHGHVKVGGGRVAARVHIRPVEKQIVDDFEKLVKKAIQS